ncbi:hypothetical protein PCK1_000395 [Pneumocystis canis]|nr:hypothetical protein PCK1_000395 [Pneumocystis canis]
MNNTNNMATYDTLISTLQLSKYMSVPLKDLNELILRIIKNIRGLYAGENRMFMFQKHSFPFLLCFMKLCKLQTDN